MNFGPHASILTLIEATDQQLQKSEFFVQQSKDTQCKLLSIVQTLRKIHVSICTKLTEKMTDDPYITAKNIAAGSKSLQKQITKTTKDFEQTIKEWSESGLKPAETCEETDTKVHYEEIVKPDLTCTRICNEFKTGIPCTHHKCTFSHSFATFSPIQCKHDGSCARLKSCECRHTMICQATGNKSLETPEQVVSRLNLVKPFPENDQPKIVQSSVPVFNAKASRDQQRQNYKQHQAQLKALDERQKLLTRVNNPVTKKSTQVEKTTQPQSTVQVVQSYDNRMTFADTMQQWNSSTWTNSQLSEFVVKTGLIAGEPLVLGHEHMNVQVMFQVIWESGFVTKKMIADHKPVLILLNPGKGNGVHWSALLLGDGKGIRCFNPADNPSEQHDEMSQLFMTALYAKGRHEVDKAFGTIGTRPKPQNQSGIKLWDALVQDKTHEGLFFAERRNLCPVQQTTMSCGETVAKAVVKHLQEESIIDREVIPTNTHAVSVVSPAVSVMSGTTMVEQIPELSLPETVSEIDKQIRDAVAAENYSLAQTLKDKKTVMQESKPMQNTIQCSTSQAIEIMKMMTQSGMSTQNMNFQIV